MPDKKNRFIYIDHARAFLFLIMIIDHALHAYAQNWGYFWFFRDYERSPLYDYLYLFNQAIIMPGLFFIMGLFVLPSFQRRGFKSFVKEKCIRLGLPFMICIPLTVPLLSFPRHETYEAPGTSYLSFLTEIFFTQRLQAGPLWVMQAMFFYSIALIFIYTLTPFFFKMIQSFLSWIRKNPLSGILAFIFISFLLLVLCDLRWGAPWWISLFGFLKREGWDIWNEGVRLFSVQASRFLMVFWYALTGAAIMELGWLKDEAFMKNFSRKIGVWISGTLIFGILYPYFSMSYFHEGAYHEVIKDFLNNGGSWYDLPRLLLNESLLVIGRNALLASLTIFQLLTIIALFYRYRTQTAQNPFWNKLAAGSYAIFLTHEVFVVWMQYALIDTSWPPFLKFLLTFSVAFGASWLLTHHILLRVKIVRRVLNPDADAKNM